MGTALSTGITPSPARLVALSLVAMAATVHAAEPATVAPPRPWQSLSHPTAADLTAHFASQPTQNDLSMTWGWAGEVTPAVITSDLDYIKARGVNIITIEAGRITNAPYLSPAYFDLVKTAVAEAKKRDMHIWFINESKYPSGFAGGKFSRERPDLRMQLLSAGPRTPVAPGQSFDVPIPDGFLCAIATNPSDGPGQIITPDNGHLHWTAPTGTTTWQVVLITHIFDTAVTRSSTSPNGAKDKHDSLMDYLNPIAVKQFLDWTEEQYKAAVGDEFGKTLLGFRGDEPEYPEGAAQPYTPAILEAFQKKKGYDPRPYLPLILAPAPAAGRGRGAAVTGDASANDTTSIQRRVHADYVDVWSDLYRDNYFAQEARWCAANNLEFQVHIDHEERQLSLIRSDGDFFKCMRFLQCPGIDTIQNQIDPHGPIADFPKFASSCAHLNGNPTAWCEAFAAYQNMNLDECRWVTNHLLVRGINRFEYMFNSSGFAARGGARGYIGDPQFPAVAAYVNRASWLMAQGKPAASIALYCPTSSFWLGDSAAYQSFLTAAQALLEHQRDCDFIDEQALSTDLKIADGSFINASGQAYRAVIIPQCTILSKTALDRLQSFASGGGKVILLGAGPTLIADKNFLTAQAANLDTATWLTHTPAQITDTTLAALPAPDVILDQPAPAIKYTHRQLADADLFMFFNESDQPLHCALTLLTLPRPSLQLLDPATGKIVSPVAGTLIGSDGIVKITVDLLPHETRFYLAQPAKK